MTSAEQLLNDVIAWATRDANVRRLLLVGSRAGAGPTDHLSDIDLQVYAVTTVPYLQDRDWLSQFGEIR